MKLEGKKSKDERENLKQVETSKLWIQREGERFRERQWRRRRGRLDTVM